MQKEGDFEDIANEILSGAADKDPKAVKKRLKWDRRFRVEEANFSKRKREFDQHIEAYKRDFDEAQSEIISLEQALKRKMRKLNELQRSIHEHNK